MRVVLGIDPSGAFHEGKGTTGWCLINQDSKEIMDVGSISAKDYPTDMQYFAANVDLLHFFKKRYMAELSIVIEDYVLYAAQAQSQTNSHMETSQLIGVLKYQAFLLDIPIKTQLANQVVQRWSDQVLAAKGILVDGRFAGISFAPCTHENDAYRHALHFATFKGAEPEGEPNGLPDTDPRALRGGTRSSSGFIPRGFCYVTEDGTRGK